MPKGWNPDDNLTLNFVPDPRYNRSRAAYIRRNKHSAATESSFHLSLCHVGGLPHPADPHTGIKRTSFGVWGYFSQNPQILQQTTTLIFIAHKAALDPIHYEGIP
jgi:hypothetical protein